MAAPIASVFAAAAVIFVGAAALGVARPAHAQSIGDAALIWRAPAGCPDAGDVRTRIERRLGAPIDRVVRGVAVDVAVDSDGHEPRYVARIALRGEPARSRDAGEAPAPTAGTGEVRVLSSERCDELADAVAVVIVRIAADAGPAGRSAAPAGEPNGIASSHARRAPPPEPPPPWGAGLRALGVSGIGALPGVSVGGELAGHVRARWLLVELAAVGWLPGSSSLHTGAQGEMDLGMRLIALRIGWSSDDLPLRAWLSSEVGSLRRAGIAFDDTSDSSRWLGIGSGFAVAWPVFPHARLVGTIEVVVPLARSFMFAGGELYRSAPVTVRSGIGVEVGWR